MFNLDREFKIYCDGLDEQFNTRDRDNANPLTILKTLTAIYIRNFPAVSGSSGEHTQRLARQILGTSTVDQAFFIMCDDQSELNFKRYPLNERNPFILVLTMFFSLFPFMRDSLTVAMSPAVTQILRTNCFLHWVYHREVHWLRDPDGDAANESNTLPMLKLLEGNIDLQCHFAEMVLSNYPRNSLAAYLAAAEITVLECTPLIPVALKEQLIVKALRISDNIKYCWVADMLIKVLAKVSIDTLPNASRIQQQIVQFILNFNSNASFKEFATLWHIALPHLELLNITQHQLQTIISNIYQKLLQQPRDMLLFFKLRHFANKLGIDVRIPFRLSKAFLKEKPNHFDAIAAASDAELIAVVKEFNQEDMRDLLKGMWLNMHSSTITPVQLLTMISQIPAAELARDTVSFAQTVCALWKRSNYNEQEALAKLLADRVPAIAMQVKISPVLFQQIANIDAMSAAEQARALAPLAFRTIARPLISEIDLTISTLLVTRLFQVFKTDALQLQFQEAIIDYLKQAVGETQRGVPSKNELDFWVGLLQSLPACYPMVKSYCWFRAFKIMASTLAVKNLAAFTSDSIAQALMELIKHPNILAKYTAKDREFISSNIVGLLGELDFSPANVEKVAIEGGIPYAQGCLTQFINLLKILRQSNGRIPADINVKIEQMLLQRLVMDPMPHFIERTEDQAMLALVFNLDRLISPIGEASLALLETYIKLAPNAFENYDLYLQITIQGIDPARKQLYLMHLLTLIRTENPHYTLQFEALFEKIFRDHLAPNLALPLSFKFYVSSQFNVNNNIWNVVCLLNFQKYGSSSEKITAFTQQFPGPAQQAINGYLGR